MRIANAIALGAALFFGGTACHDYLTGPSLGGSDPNNVKGIKSPDALYVGIEAAQMANYTGQTGRFVSLYMQQVSGVARQQQGFDLYVVGPGDVDGSFSAFWAGLGLGEGGGGAGDARRVQAIGHNLGDSIYVGVAMVWEAMLIGDAASIWGPVPYSQAFNVTLYPQPKYDAQLTALAEVETTLDSAILYLKATPSKLNLGPTGPLPGNISRHAEIIFPAAGPALIETIYTEVAHTLKARYYLHMAGADPSNYAKALAESQLGISTPAHDWNWYANTATGGNEWYQFMGARADIAPGAAIMNLMRARVVAGTDIDNGRFGLYFEDGNGNPCTLNPDTGCTGFRPGGNLLLPGGSGTANFYFINNDGSFDVPNVTFAENGLIEAEAALQTGNAGLARTAVNAVRANQAYGADALDAGDTVIADRCSPTCVFKPQPALGAVTLREIMEEKYIDLYAELEVWNDYKRTCLPWLAPAPSSPTSTVNRAAIPGRLPFGLTAISADPNTPNLGATARNDDNPAACPSLTYSSTPAAW